ncbi:MAG: IS110 family RNA-guided transposase [Longimicrobiales bacterium]
MLPNLTIGLDLGDRLSQTCGVNASGAEVFTDAVVTTPKGMQEYFSRLEPCRVVMEVGTHSPWVSRMVEQLGHEVVVANPTLVYGPRRRKKRNDRMDAAFLARQGRADVQLLHPIRHRGEAAQEHLAAIRARDQLVRARTKLINHVRGAVKALGARLPKCSAEAFARRAAADIPESVRGSLVPLLEVIADLTSRIRSFDQQIERVIQDLYPEAIQVQQPKGVGPITALAFVLLIEDPHRFRRSRDVGAYFGLVPRLDESSSSSPQLRITKAGDKLGRRLLVSSAQYILGPHGPECDLRRHGEAIAQRGGKNAKKRAAVAVARKLSVLLHRLWVTGATYDPDWVQKRRAA